MAYKGPKGRNISNENLREIFKFIDNFHPKNEVEERNLAILKYAYEQDMSAESIYKLNDPRMVGTSNHNKGGRMTPTSISRIIKSYNLEKEPRIDFSKRKSLKRRNEFSIMNKKQKRLDLKFAHVVELERI